MTDEEIKCWLFIIVFICGSIYLSKETIEEFKRPKRDWSSIIFYGILAATVAAVSIWGILDMLNIW